jgi:hypothetical protein
LFTWLSENSRAWKGLARHKRTSFNWGLHTMLRLALAIAIAAPLLSGCIIVSTEKPTTRVITTPASDQ